MEKHQIVHPAIAECTIEVIFRISLCFLWLVNLF